MTTERTPRSVLVFCASSSTCDPAYHDAAASLGHAIASAGDTLVYGGGAVGSMGAMADAALAQGGSVVGVIPRFMRELEWAHPGLTELQLVDDMHERKREMLRLADAIVALPGGSGTFEELFEAITQKRLGLFTKADHHLQSERLLRRTLRAARAQHRRTLHEREARRDLAFRR